MLLFQAKIAKGLIVRRQADYPAMDEMISDWDSESNASKKKTKSRKSTPQNVSLLVLSFLISSLLFLDQQQEARKPKRRT